MNFVWGLISKLFDSIAASFAEYFREARRDAKLEELGWNEHELERLRKERSIIRRAREIEDATPISGGVDGELAATLERLRNPS